jgi:two-component system OmpR family response regulator
VKARILHIEDDPSLQKLVRVALEQLGGFEVRTVADGPSALAIAGPFAPQLILLDLDLPGMSGVETLHALRAVEGLRDVPAVFLTAAADPRVLSELHALGAHVLHKPFRPRPLVEALARLIARKET